MHWLLLLASVARAEPEMIPATDSDLVGRTAPDFSVPTWDGKGTFKLSEHHGKTVILSFWASWCGPCRAELPALSTWAKDRKDVEVFAVNVDKTSDKANAFLQRVQVDLPLLADHDSVALGEFGVTAMPTMVVVDRNGTVKYEHAGYSAEKGFKELEDTLGAK